ncbi:MAG: hypothetical protein JXR91_13455, partial [Deltaproteobacteria bacterium]|nr:hypothetical protein [Deltaproteobacteria bacterium]
MTLHKLNEINFKTFSKIAFLTASLFVSSITGCTGSINFYYHQDTRPYFTNTPPPPPPVKFENKTASPSDNHIWIEGYWKWNYSSKKWIWITGHWTVPPKKNSKWVKPQYGQSGKDTYYKPAHWETAPHIKTKKPVVRQTKQKTVIEKQNNKKAADKKAADKKAADKKAADKKAADKKAADKKAADKKAADK